MKKTFSDIKHHINRGNLDRARDVLRDALNEAHVQGIIVANTDGITSNKTENIEFIKRGKCNTR